VAKIRARMHPGAMANLIASILEPGDIERNPGVAVETLHHRRIVQVNEGAEAFYALYPVDYDYSHDLDEFRRNTTNNRAKLTRANICTV